MLEPTVVIAGSAVAAIVEHLLARLPGAHVEVVDVVPQPLRCCAMLEAIIAVSVSPSPARAAR